MTRLFNLPSNNLRNQLLDEILQGPTRSLFRHDFHHPFPNLPDLRRLSIRRLFDLIWSTFCECNDKNSQQIAICGFYVCVRFNESLPLADEGFEFVGGEGHAGEVCETVFALDFVDAELDFSEGVIFVGLKICKGDFEDSALECVVGGF